MRNKVISFFVCMIVAPSLFLAHIAGALMIQYGDVSVIPLTLLIAPLPLAMLLHIVYPLHKIDEAFAS